MRAARAAAAAVGVMVGVGGRTAGQTGRSHVNLILECCWWWD